MKWFVVFWLLYTAGGFLTAAYNYQHVYEPCWEAEQAKPVAERRMSSCDVPPFVGMFWPAYWAWQGAKAVTR